MWFSWKTLPNVVFYIPKPTDWGKHQNVIFTIALDSSGRFAKRSPEKSESEKYKNKKKKKQTKNIPKQRVCASGTSAWSQRKERIRQTKTRRNNIQSYKEDNWPSVLKRPGFDDVTLTVNSTSNYDVFISFIDLIEKICRLPRKIKCAVKKNCANTKKVEAILYSRKQHLH